MNTDARLIAPRLVGRYFTGGISGEGSASDALAQIAARAASLDFDLSAIVINPPVVVFNIGDGNFYAVAMTGTDYEAPSTDIPRYLKASGPGFANLPLLEFLTGFPEDGREEWRSPPSNAVLYSLVSNPPFGWTCFADDDNAVSQVFVALSFNGYRGAPPRWPWEVLSWRESQSPDAAGWRWVCATNFPTGLDAFPDFKLLRVFDP
jgi:hypothetical protein